MSARGRRVGVAKRDVVEITTAEFFVLCNVEGSFVCITIGIGRNGSVV